MKRLLKITFSILVATSLYGQDVSDVLRLSQGINYGTARFVSMGGAFGALGADFSSLSYNPAGLGVFRSSEFTITTGLKNRIDETNFMNSDPYSDSRSRFLLDNIGIVTSFTSIKEKEGGLVMLNLGIGYNRINDFYGEVTSGGRNLSNSIMDYFALRANHYTPHQIDDFSNSNAPWEAVMAWWTYLIDPDPNLNPTPSGDTLYYVRSINPDDIVYQSQTISSEGGVGEYTFSLGANIANKLYLGATIGVQDVYYNHSIYYSEIGVEGNSPSPVDELGHFQRLNYNQSLTVDGSGVNFKLGLIYRPIPDLRIGLAAHTPTYYKLSERYSADMESQFSNFSESDSSPINFFDYRIESPFKFIGSLAYSFGSVGLISFDYEYVDYSTMRFGKGGDGLGFPEENKSIKNDFTNTFNIRTGGEIWIGQLALRAGYALYGSPYKSDVDFSSSAINVFSGGFGLRIDNLFIDWAYQRYQFNDSFLLYPLIDSSNINNSPISERDTHQNKFMLTVGFKF